MTSTPAPEPASAGLLALSGGALLMRRRCNELVITPRVDENPQPRQWGDQPLI